MVKALLRSLLAVSVLSWACGQLPEGPTEPAPPTEREPVAPAPPGSENPPGATPVLGTPTTTPSPTPDPETGEDPGDGDAPANPPPSEPSGPSSSGCFPPLPPEISRFNVKVHLRGAGFWTIDSTPLVGPDPSYCALIGFTDNRAYCPVRPEGHPERLGCEAWRVGKASDTGRVGPTWTRDGRLCTGSSGCENSPDNQFQVRAIEGGLYRACATNGVCGEVVVDR